MATLKDLPGDSDERSGGFHLVISPAVLTMFVSAGVFGGFGAGGIWGPTVDKAALEACFDNSRTALDVVAQHGSEFIRLEQVIDDRTRYRYTSEDAGRDKATLERRDAEFERRIQQLERLTDRHEKGHRK